MIKVITEYKKALAKKMPERISADDQTLTFQEFYLFYLLRWNSNEPESMIDPQQIYDDLQKGGWIDQRWLQMSASKKQPKIFDKPWDQVF